MNNYTIIKDMDELQSFIEFLPILEDNECYYVALFARKKYHESAKNDKSQCKRFTATTKEWLLKKIKQLEIKGGMYTNKDGSYVHQDALVLYISINPRSFETAQYNTMKRLIDVIHNKHYHMNPVSIAFSEIQKSKSRTVFVDFDFDGVSYNPTQFEGVINKDAYEVLITRGGYHLLVNISKIGNGYKFWYRDISSFEGVDVCGDNIIPVAGCVQGDTYPYMIDSFLK